MKKLQGKKRPHRLCYVAINRNSPLLQSRLDSLIDRNQDGSVAKLERGRRSIPPDRWPTLDRVILRAKGNFREASGREIPDQLALANDPTLALFARWDAEDATDDPEEIARRQRDGDELLRSLAENPISFRRTGVGGDIGA